MGSGALPDEGRKTYRSVELVGTYPDTNLVVAFDDYGGRHREASFALWGEGGFTLGSDQYEAPNSVVGLVITHLDEL